MPRRYEDLHFLQPSVADLKDTFFTVGREDIVAVWKGEEGSRKAAAGYQTNIKH